MAKPRRRPHPKSRPTRRRPAYLILGIALAGVGALWALRFAHRRPELPIDDTLAAYQDGAGCGGLTIHNPLDETLFPPEFPPPTFRWEDASAESERWIAAVEFPDGGERVSALCSDKQWTPSDEQWEQIKGRSVQSWARVTVLGFHRSSPKTVLSAASIRIGTSRDEVGAPIFYREVNLPFIEAVKDPSRIRWRFGTVGSKEPPVVLEKLPVCGNCHSFSADGAVLGMDVDYANDKGSYVIDRVAEEMVLDKGKIITWSDYKREDGDLTFGMLSQVSPDGRYVVSTVKDRSVFVPKDDLAFSQLFFPFKGILVVYDRTKKSFRALPGADDPQFVQTNPAWSPDGRFIVFARSKAHRADHIKSLDKVLLTREECREFLEGERTFNFDLYRIPFHDGGGGAAEPLAGASGYGMSNYFPKYSPDGKWIVFCKAKTFMLLQPDSELYIIPASGGEARRLRCNTARMNSWHSWSPNGKWLVFSSKAHSAYTQLFLSHIGEDGVSSPAVVLSHFTAPDRAANIPEFVRAAPGAIRKIREQFVDEFSYLRTADDFFDRGYYDAAARFYTKVLEVNPRNADVHNNLGIILLAMNAPAAAESHFSQAVKLNPRFSKAYSNLGNALIQQRRLPEGIAALREALRIDPRLANAHLSLGVVLLNTGKTGESRAHLAEALRLQPDDASANGYYAQLLEREGEIEQAAVHYRRALERDPGSLPALVGLALARATSAQDALRNGAEAVQLATRACELSGHKDPRALDALAAAYAETGRFADAVATAQQALRLARAAGSDLDANAIGQRIEKYRQGLPWRAATSPVPRGKEEPAKEGGAPSAPRPAHPGPSTLNRQP